MGKLDITQFTYLKKSHFRVLTAIEMGMKNHEYVPDLLIYTISSLKKSIGHKILKELSKFRMIEYEKMSNNDGYRLTYYGYDILSLRAITLAGYVSDLGCKVGVGKESDIYIGRTPNGERVILKFARLGRNSFRKIKEKRNYLQNRTHASWLYCSRLAATKEFQFMQGLHKAGFPVPTPIYHNRHCVVMSLVDGFPLNQVTHLQDPEKSYTDCRDLLKKLAESGWIHCDFNEFNLIIDIYSKIHLIDFPQMVSTDHPNAQEYLDRDVTCVDVFFGRNFSCKLKEPLKLSSIEKSLPLDLPKNNSNLFETEMNPVQTDEIVDETAHAHTDMNQISENLNVKLWLENNYEFTKLPNELPIDDCCEEPNPNIETEIAEQLEDIDLNLQGDSASVMLGNFESKTIPIPPDVIKQRVISSFIKKQRRTDYKQALKNSKKNHNIYRSTQTKYVISEFDMD